MKKPNSLLIIFSVTLFCLSCSVPVSNKAATSQSDSQVFTRCKEPRPEICTREYNPVCATLNTNKQQKTYGNGCSACADPAVVKYRPGQCEK